MKKLQDTVQQFMIEKDLFAPLKDRLLDFASEFGELSKELLKATDYGKADFAVTQNWKEELGDVFFSLICIANQTDCDLEVCLKQSLRKYESRFAANQTISSNQ